MPNNLKLTFIGGDNRQYFMVKTLAEQGANICVYGLELLQPIPGVIKASDLKTAMDFSNIIVGPVPFSKGQIYVTSYIKPDDLTVQAFISNIKENHIIFGGAIPPSVQSYCKERGITCVDFMKCEDVAIKNAIATAEGTIVEAITKSNIVLHKSPCLILGFGRCATVLAGKLKGLDAKVTISARKKEALCLAQAIGYDILPMGELKEHISSYSFLFNTIPALILDSALLECVKPETTIIDISSRPGGVDFEEAYNLDLNASLCLGLPGKYAPKTSADILIEALMAHLKSPN